MTGIDTVKHYSERFTMRKTGLRGYEQGSLIVVAGMRHGIVGNYCTSCSLVLGCDLATVVDAQSANSVNCNAPLVETSHNVVLLDCLRPGGLPFGMSMLP